MGKMPMPRFDLPLFIVNGFLGHDINMGIITTHLPLLIALSQPVHPSISGMHGRRHSHPAQLTQINIGYIRNTGSTKFILAPDVVKILIRIADRERL